METTEPVSGQYENAQNFWLEQLAPANKMEKRLALLIAKQDYLMWASMQRALELNQEPMFSKYIRIHRELAATLDSLVHTLSTLQRQRLALEPMPPPRADAKANVIQFPKR